MRYASNILQQEHKVILLALDILEAMTGRFCRDEDVDMGDILDIIQFFDSYVDGYHCAREETVFYPVIEKHTAPIRSGAIRQILDEHELARQYYKDLYTAAQHKESQKDMVVASSDAYIDLMRRHIQNEEQVMFPLCDLVLPMEEQASLVQEFEEYERANMSAKNRALLFDMLLSFEQKYLKNVV